jgi:predicted RNA-binding Zn-ribbon protein involved in translation (DUF1610 family)
MAKKQTKRMASFKLPNEVLMSLALASRASGIPMGTIVEQGILDRVKQIPLDCPECGKKMVGGRCSSPASHA